MLEVGVRKEKSGKGTVFFVLRTECVCVCGLGGRGGGRRGMCECVRRQACYKP